MARRGGLILSLDNAGGPTEEELEKASEKGIGELADIPADGADFVDVEEPEVALLTMAGDDTIKPQEVHEDEGFLPSVLPDPETLLAEFNGQPRLYIGEFAIVLASKNFEVHLYASKRVLKGPKRGQILTKFYFLGHYYSFAGVLRCIQNQITSCAFSLANHRHLGEVVQYMKSRDQALLSSLEALSLDESTHGQVVRSDSLLKRTKKKKVRSR